MPLAAPFTLFFACSPCQPRRPAAPRTRVAAVPKHELRGPREENAPGDFYVDKTCIDCDICRWMAPETYTRINDQAAVSLQPQTSEERRLALLALLACPAFSIHARNKKAAEWSAILQDLPLPVPGMNGVYHLVLAAGSSYGAISYLICRPGGNIMMDSPRFDSRLLKRIEALGGVKYMCLSHRDDVCDHARWAAALGCTRIMHKTECHPSQGTDAVEVQLTGEGPWQLPDGDGDFELIHTPGHTTGHVVLLHRPERVLFSGDHWVYSGEDQSGSLMRKYNQHSMEIQMVSMEKLKPLDFLHVLPGHRRRMSFTDTAAKNAAIDLTIAAEKADIREPGAGRKVFRNAADASFMGAFGPSSN